MTPGTSSRLRSSRFNNWLQRRMRVRPEGGRNNMPSTPQPTSGLTMGKALYCISLIAPKALLHDWLVLWERQQGQL